MVLIYPCNKNNDYITGNDDENSNDNNGILQWYGKDDEYKYGDHEDYDNHDDVIKWKHFPRNWPFVRGIHRSRWIPHAKASDAELWCLLWSASE